MSQVSDSRTHIAILNMCTLNEEHDYDSSDVSMSRLNLRMRQMKALFNSQLMLNCFERRKRTVSRALRSKLNHMSEIIVSLLKPDLT